jgi:hypothetical protein
MFREARARREPSLAVCCAVAEALQANETETAVRENFSLIVMCVFMVLSLAFLAQQILAYH